MFLLTIGAYMQWQWILNMNFSPISSEKIVRLFDSDVFLPGIVFFRCPTILRRSSDLRVEYCIILSCVELYKCSKKAITDEKQWNDVWIDDIWLWNRMVKLNSVWVFFFSFFLLVSIRRDIDNHAIIQSFCRTSLWSNRHINFPSISSLWYWCASTISRP